MCYMTEREVMRSQANQIETLRKENQYLRDRIECLKETIDKLNSIIDSLDAAGCILDDYD